MKEYSGNEPVRVKYIDPIHTKLGVLFGDIDPKTPSDYTLQAIFEAALNNASTGGATADAEYKSPDDFTATYTSANTITISGLNFTPTSAQIKYITRIPVSGDAETLINGSGGVTMTISSNIITVSGATNSFASGDVYEIGINGQKKAFDKSTEGDMINILNPSYARNTDPEPLITSAQTLSTSFADVGSEFNTSTYKKVFFWADIDIGSDTNVKFKVLAKHTSGSTDEFPLSDSSVTVHTNSTYVAAASSRYFELNDDVDQKVLIEVTVGNAINYLQLQASSGTHTDGQLSTVYITKGY